MRAHLEPPAVPAAMPPPEEGRLMGVLPRAHQRLRGPNGERIVITAPEGGWR